MKFLALKIQNLRVFIFFISNFQFAKSQLDYNINEKIGGLGRPKLGEIIPKPTVFNRITCGGNFLMELHGYLKFRLNKTSLCEVGFLGSAFSSCTTETICTSISTNNPSAKLCDEEYIEISDGLGGALKGCGQLSLKIPFKARNNGRDLYFKFKGMSDKGYCEVFCGQDKNLYKGHNSNLVSKEILKTQKDTRKIKNSCVCGIKKDKTDGKIVGGGNANPFEFPWLAAMTLGKVNQSRNVSTRSSFCGASLITDRHMLTAAHCVDKKGTGIDPKDMNILLHAHLMDLSHLTSSAKQEQIEKIPGWNLPSKSDQEENSIRLEIKNVKIHPFYNSRKLDYDIAILTLNNRLNLQRTDLITPICLPQVGQSEYKIPNTVEVAGWGRPIEGSVAGSRILQKVQLPIIPWEMCKNQTNRPLLPRHFCAGFIETGAKDTCQGDSGSPVFYKTGNNQHIQLGVVSSGLGCARPGGTAFHTNVTEVLEWIYRNTRKATWCKDR